MALLLRNSIKNRNNVLVSIVRHQSGPSNVAKDVPGLSKTVVDVPKTEVGPGASKSSQYKNPEYFCYNNISYFEAEVEMSKFRLPQPSSKKAKQ